MCFLVCCASPRWCVASFVRSYLLFRLCVPPPCPFIPFCLSVAVLTLRRCGHARTGIPSFPYVCGGGHRHSFGVTSCWFSLPVRFFVALFVAAHFGVAWHVSSFLVYCVCYGVMHGVMRYGDMHGVAYNILVFRRLVALLLLVRDRTTS